MASLANNPRAPSPQVEPTKNAPLWIGVDLDGTLAKLSKWRGFQSIGKPIKPMLERIHRWQEAGYQVKIFTARASIPEAIPPIKKWLKKHQLEGLEITNRKDFAMVEFWDDRCIQVLTNSGRPIRSSSIMAHPQAPLLEEAFPHENRPSLIDPNEPN